MDQLPMAAGAYDELFVACTSMKLFFNARDKRNTAFMVWLAWLFALASGVANACSLQARQTHAAIAAAASDDAAAHAAVMVTGLVF